MYHGCRLHMIHSNTRYARVTSTFCGPVTHTYTFPRLLSSYLHTLGHTPRPSHPVYYPYIPALCTSSPPGMYPTRGSTRRNEHNVPQQTKKRVLFCVGTCLPGSRYVRTYVRRPCHKRYQVPGTYDLTHYWWYC